MKIFKLFPLACAALMMCACSSDDASNGGSTGVNEPQYLSVNIVNVGATPSRATSEEYENGSADENKISKVRFYFFNGDGTPYLIKAPGADGVTGDGTVNWLEATPGDDKTTSDAPSHVEKITNAVLVINGVQSAAPSAIVAVINPETLDPVVLENNGSMRLTQLRENAVGSTFYKTDASKGTVSDFVMSNSVFVNAGSDVCASLVAGHVATTADKAKANPVDLYVERVAAKVTADFDSKAFKTGDGTNWDATQYGTTTAVGKIGAYDVYAVIDGWGLADENGKAKAEKSVNTGWTNGILGINPWTTYDYRRCFWESSVEFNAGTNQPVNHKFNDFKANMGAELYTLPNTPDAQITNVYENNVTKFLVAATLKYKDEHENWHLAEICRYNGVMILGVDNLKTQVALTFSKYYTSTDGSKYTQLTKDDITFAEPTTSMKNYQVTPTLVDDPAGKKEYYTKASDGSFTSVDKDVVNAAIGENKAEIRTEGKAYYYVPIKHLGTTGSLGEYGVVRNHFYKINLTGLTGFGTPVYNPETVIDPTVPSYDNTYLAARIKVLQWRVVKQDVNIGK
ncbi:Mfa1 family fimbria major subunit [Prevotella sp.]|uniref:Mfa1 family fimbria major subunit n=1 Tax=Prevotella sp. TaxID=59823 RepID=UPI0025F646DB|nr:Mfa1 family fimbria major subunit [Prevotella sp.]